MELLRSIDIFGIKPLLSVDGERNKSFKTYTGGWLSIIFIILIIIITVYFFIFSMFFSKSGSIVSFSSYYKKDNYSKFIFGNDLNFALVGINSDYTTVFLDPDLFSIDLISTKFNLNPMMTNNSEINFKIKSVSPNICNLTKNSKFSVYQESFIRQKKILCFKDGDDFVLGGNMLENGEIYYARLLINANSSHPRYQSVIDKLIYIAFMSEFSSPRVLDIQNPQSNTQLIYYFNTFTGNILNIQYVSFVSYESIFPFTEPTLNITFPIVSSFIQQGNNKNLLVVDFAIDNNLMNINRKYDTIDLYLAKYTSIINLLMIIFSNISFFISDKEFHVDYINKFIKVENSCNLESFETRFSQDKLTTQTTSRKSNNLKIKARNQSDNIKINTNLEISIYDMICNRKSSKFKEYQYFYSILGSILTYENIINVITDVKRLKHLLFDENEEKFFDFYLINGYCENNFSLNRKNKEIQYKIIRNIMSQNEKQLHKCFSLKKLIPPNFSEKYLI